MTAPIEDRGRLQGLDGFERVTFVARGGSATVYRAWSIESERWVAIKLLDPSAHRVADREADVLTQLAHHPHVVDIEEVGVTDDGRPYLVEDFVGGGSLEAQRGAGARFPPSRVIQLGVELAGALAAAHDVGIVHGDVKPSNVLMDPDRSALLCDFGISQTQSLAITAGQTFSVTVLYAAPEVLEGARASVQADIYSLGLTLYTLAVGEQPYVGAAELGLVPLIDAICRRPLPPLDDETPRALSDVIAIATAKDPDDRFASMHDFETALRDAERGIGPTARRSRQRLPHGSRLAAAAISVLVVALVAVGLWWLRRPQSTRSEAALGAEPASAHVEGPGRVSSPSRLRWAKSTTTIPSSFAQRADGYLEIASYIPDDSYRLCLAAPLRTVVPEATKWCRLTYRGDGHGPSAPGRIDPSRSQMYVRVDLRDGATAFAVLDTCAHPFVVDPDTCTRGEAPIVETDVPYSNRYRTDWKSCGEPGSPFHFPFDELSACLSAAGQWFPLGAAATPFLNVHEQADVPGGPLRITFHRALPDGDPSVPRALSDAELDLYPDGRLHVRRDCFPAMEIQWIDPKGRHEVLDAPVSAAGDVLPPAFAAAKDKECVTDGTW